MIFTASTAVSIPNGMEFYAGREGALMLQEQRFNSQRDGILLRRLAYFSFKFTQFQFPTGWNSTSLLVFSSSSICLFQFPTGWNSTLSYQHRHRNYWRFNSQRDGILPKWCSYSKQLWVVSIPNGMEFYGRECWPPRPRNSFNSQRDGILLYRSARTIFKKPSFNSQRDGILQDLSLRYVFWKMRFNSQRDGILRQAEKKRYQTSLFQFPTGWNSTARILPFF